MYVVDIVAKPLVVGVNWIACVMFVMPVTLYVKLNVGDAPAGMDWAVNTAAD
ncbi:MAG: hypothetical protein AABX69_00190 [Nanoarchaeota archaeon]